MTGNLARLADSARRHRVGLSLASTVLLAVGLAGAISAYDRVDRSTSMASQLQWTEAAAFTYDVPVTRGNESVWPVGTVLPMGLPAYFATVSDRVDVAFAWNATGPEAPVGNVTAEMALRIRAATTDGRAYWEVEHPLANASTPHASTGIRMSGVRVDLDALANETDHLTHELPPGEGKVTWTVETVVAYGGDSPGENATSTFDMPIVPSEPRILLPAASDVASARPHAVSYPVTTESRGGWDAVLTSQSSLAALALGALGLGSAAASETSLRRHGARELAFQQEHARYREWVSAVAGKLDARRFPSNVVDLPTLGDLVEAAADARTRVLLDDAHRVYYAVLPNATYRYARHARRPPAA